MNDNPATPSAVYVGKLLDRLIKGLDGPSEPERAIGLLSALVGSRCETTADLLALVAHGNDLVRQACLLLEDEDMPIDQGEVSRFLLWSILINARVLDALEGATGLPASGFLGTGPTIN
ncbi:hypothetical protein D3218_01720 [Aureimonas flava]|uniref:Uncharacterized protein n=1 Tax=Aureimonas flava TaxID=2320271 RepID=A0A3A1WWV5_9HYPH|nr:hypothetical protein [Aureimonas flava]RIY03502.1 hypothetical protein D3218_01720 [Aureimonas flava]